jgi:hypothetical protein
MENDVTTPISLVTDITIRVVHVGRHATAGLGVTTAMMLRPNNINIRDLMAWHTASLAAIVLVLVLKCYT